MKINWGTGIVIAMVLFMSFIAFFVIKSFDSDNKHFLVDEEYYKSELKYQEEIDKQENTKTLSSKVVILKTATGYVIEFPEEINEDTTGTISFLRPSSKVLDFEIPIAIIDNKMSFEHENLVSGNWNIRIDFKSNSEEYLVKRSITY
ncbi:MAG: FixH family protein [Flavobacteriaceae bacterium]